MVGTYRRHIGPHFSEAARLLWARLPELAVMWNVKPTAAREELTRRLGTGRGTIAKYLYGDRKPGRVMAGKLEEIAGIPMSAWDLEPTREFSLSPTGTG